MILHRIRLAHYRGVEAREVAFGPGVTIVEGPNEVGKSSLIEALGIVFEFKDDSKAGPVKAIAPVHRDESPEIEVELTTGPYRFVYRKRYGRGARTELEVAQPRAESLTGREAHERVERILAETLDRALWDALQVVQGAKLEQATLRDSRALQRALDAAAGGSGLRDEDNALAERVKEEFLRYFTEKGHKKKELAEVAERVAPLRTRVDELDAKRRALEADVTECERLAARQRALERELPGLEAEARRLDDERKEVERRRTAVDTVKAQAQAARLATETAQRALDERLAKAAAAEEARRALAALEASAAGERAPADSARSALDSAAAREAEAKAALAAAEALQALRAGDYQLFQDELFRAQLEERHARIEAHRETLRRARAVLEVRRVGDAEVKQLQESEFALRQARARLEEGGPSLALRALRDVEIDHDGVRLALRAGETRSVAGGERSVLRIPDTLEIELRAGTSAEALQRAVEQARAARHQLLAQLGVASLQAAIEANEARKTAERDAAEAERGMRSDLRDLTPDSLSPRIEGLVARIAHYRARRAPEPPLPADLDAAKALAEAAGAAREAAREAQEAAQRAVEAARTRLAALESARIRLDTQIESARARLQVDESQLEAARAAAPDEALLAAAQERAQAATDAAKREAELRLGLEALNPERVEALAQAARTAHERARDEARELAERLSNLRGRLEALEEAGLFEEHERAAAALEQAERHAAALARRAGAAQLLHETLERRRDAARKAYVAPLAQQIERLGRIVFDPSFEVTLGDDLAIVSCTRAGRTIPFESLSGGAQEQVGLLARVAVALTVSREEGVPLLLDDTLGHSDADRLRSMSAMLARAGEACQIIVLTCAPERFRAVAGARVQRIERA